MIQVIFCFFFFNDTATTEIYTLSLHDALPIFGVTLWEIVCRQHPFPELDAVQTALAVTQNHMRLQVLLRSEEHTSELQSRQYLVCRLLLEKKTKTVFKLQMLIHAISKIKDDE